MITNWDRTTRWPIVDQPYRCVGVPATFTVGHDHAVHATWQSDIMPRLGASMYDDTGHARVKLGIDIGMASTNYDANIVAEFVCWLLPNTPTITMLEMWEEAIFEAEANCPACGATWTPFENGKTMDHHRPCRYIDGMGRCEWDDDRVEPDDDQTAEDIERILDPDAYYDSRVDKA